MSDSGRLQADPLFLALARPTMIAGVSYLFFVFNGLLNIIAFIQTSSFVVLMVIFPFIHLMAFLVCLKEPRMMELVILRCSKGMRCVNRAYHNHTNSYDLF